MIEFWAESIRFKTSQKLADLIRKIRKNGLFSDLEILEMHQNIYSQTHQQTPNTVTLTLNTGKPKTLHDNGLYTANTQTQTLKQEKNNVDMIKRIMSEKKARLHSRRNQDWRTVNLLYNSRGTSVHAFEFS